MFGQQAQRALSFHTWKSSSCAVHFSEPVQSDACHALDTGSQETRDGPSVSSYFETSLSRLPRKLESVEARQPGFNPSSLLTSYVTLGKMLNLSVPQFPHL